MFWRLLTASGLSNLADGLVKVSLPLVAVQFTHSPALIAGLAFAVTVPWLLFALPAGALADRLDRRLAMIGANAVRATAIGCLAFGAGSIWLLYAVAFAIGTAETIHDTAAQSILPQVVPRTDLSRANGRLFAVEFTANEFAGPPIAGVLVAAGSTLAFATPAGLWFLALGALLLVRGRFRVERATRTTLRADIAEGLRFLWRNRLLRTLAVMVGAINLVTSAVFGVFVLYAVGPMGLSEQAYGLLMACTAAGSVAGSFAAGFLERRIGRARSLVLTILCATAMVGVPAFTNGHLAVGSALFVGGAGIMVWNVITVSLRQRVTPDRLLGRLSSAYRLVAWGTMPLGAAIGGLLAQFAGVRVVFVAGALVLLAQLAAMRIVTDRRMDEAERDAIEP
ncbi:MFS transporter [Amycolatopsis suaedae]|nr:MFS transporter [Amycolatopsis suaedae]